MIKFFRTAAASAAAIVLAVLFAVQAQAASPTQQVASSHQGDGDLIFAGVAGLFILAAAFGVIIYAARHRNSEQ
ncbi:hypothetical protein [Kutzneria sp. CA-103260]|uniref:hypothetical protein n=1 Tax=Kutzneria sp. CA-103260 TaxID=2802641 RepID=UPI001BADE3F1|nr:hypothetical protein [Kutzneria sp. CA-103260]QUQ69124.1 hypothetical protein JJ691_68780 [Kutzneria sp. CA-103260]